MSHRKLHAESHSVRNTLLGAAALASIGLSGAVWHAWPKTASDHHTSDSLQLTARLLANHVAQARQACGRVYQSTVGHEMFLLLDGREVRVAISKNLDGQPASTSVTVRDGELYRTMAYPSDFSVRGSASWQNYRGEHYPVNSARIMSEFAKIQAQVVAQCGIAGAPNSNQLTSGRIALQ